MQKNKNMNRRKFLENTALAGTIGIMGVSMLAGCSKKRRSEELGIPPLNERAPAGKRLKAGLIGCGHRGTGALLNFLSTGPGVEVGALADVFPDKITEVRERLGRFNIEVPDDRCFSGLDAYKKVMQTDVDVVLLVTPPFFRPDHFRTAIEAKKHVFMEKPVAVDPVGIRSVIATSRMAKTLGLNVVTGTQRRHQHDYLATFERVANGAIGQPVAAKAFWNQEHVWFRRRQEGWTDMEYMLRNWNNYTWLSGDHILDTHIHNIDVVNWFMEKYPVAAIGYGGRHRRVTGDQFDFFSIDFSFGNGVSSHSMCRQIDNCANGVGEIVMGTKGYTNCLNTIYNLDGSIKWQYQYPNDEQGNPMNTPKISPYIQEHIHLVTAIRTGYYINEGERTALSNLAAIMGRESAYTGRRITWDEIYNSNLKLGPEDITKGNVDMKFEVPIPGTPVRS
ncbi:Gfo/Idh/MocA family protein [Alkalitalea saponilacus]|uniref:Predicted dehydrogenase n=2 Tax=Alkalitalea saponilacus TaxID=889453 RepID=A0A1T5HNJ0_9BACT|nr:Gfo/Idh/MocA family oxidoreductase [Alkalitalea saponilacus]SKC22110.1 Predicted dehydrogenase [Alkalitalea saponilacus]